MASTARAPKRARETARQRRKQAEKLQRQKILDEQRAVARADKARWDEKIAESVAPAIVRNAVMAGDTMLRGPRVEVVNGRPSRVNQVAAVLNAAGELPPDNRHRDVIGNLASQSCMITPALLKAARTLQADWAEVGGGFGLGASNYGEYSPGSGVGGFNEGRHSAMLSQIAARTRLDGALTWLGASADIVVPVVIGCISVAEWARARKPEAWQPRQAIGYLALCLAHLKSFYDQPGERLALDLQELGTVDDIRSMVTEDVARRYPAFGPPARAIKSA